MDELEATVQKHINNFCKILPIHVEKWRNVLSNVNQPVTAIVNYAEQLRHVERCDLNYIDGFPSLQQNLEDKIFSEIEYEISILSGLIDTLNKVNHETRNKLSVLEKSTVDLNWENKSLLLKGSALQPPLSRILQDGLGFWFYFAKALKPINENFKSFNIRDVKSMNAFKSLLKLS